MEPSNEVKLLGTWSCPYVNRVQLALKFKSIEYEFIEENMLDKSEFLIKSNPVHKKIPVLIHGGKTVCESLIIVQYVDDAWLTSPSLLPSDPYERAVARFWADYIDTKWYPLIRLMRQSEEEEERASLKERIHQGLLLLEEAFISCTKGDKPYFGGDHLGFLDIILGSTLMWLKVTNIATKANLLDENTTPKLAQWASTFCSYNIVKDVIPNMNELFDLYLKIQAYIKSGSK